MIKFCPTPHPVEIEHAHTSTGVIRIFRCPDGTWTVQHDVEPIRGLGSRSAAQEIARAICRQEAQGLS